MNARERQSGAAAAFDLACRLLGRTRRSEADVQARLTDLGFSAQAVEKAMCRLRELHFVDDRSLARTRAQELAVRGYGNAWIGRDLRERNLPDEVVDEALAVLEPESERARRWIERRLGDRGARTAWRSLLQRGFTPEDAECALRAAGYEDDEGYW